MPGPELFVWLRPRSRAEFRQRPGSWQCRAGWGSAGTVRTAGSCRGAFPQRRCDDRLDEPRVHVVDEAGHDEVSRQERIVLDSCDIDGDGGAGITDGLGREIGLVDAERGRQEIGMSAEAGDTAVVCCSTMRLNPGPGAAPSAWAIMRSVAIVWSVA